MKLIFGILMIGIYSSAANSIGGNTATGLVSDLNHLQMNHLNNGQYSIHDNIKDEQQMMKSSNNPQMDEHEAIRILLQNYKSSKDYQPNHLNTNINNQQPQPPQPPQHQQQQQQQPPWQSWIHNTINDQVLRTPNRFQMPAVTYVQPIFIPYPIMLNPQQFISSFSDLDTDYEDTMSRGNRRTSTNSAASTTAFRNSPIYYVRLPPTPYAILPGLGGYTSSQQHNFGTSTYNPYPFMGYNSGLRALAPYHHHSQPPTISSLLNLPVNFLANGKPTNIYQMDGSNELSYHPSQLQQHQQHQQSTHFSTNSPLLRPYQQQQQPHNTYIQQPSATDSKVTNLKRQYYFNGRPDDEVYILPNFDRWNSNYQNSIPTEYY